MAVLRMWRIQSVYEKEVPAGNCTSYVKAPTAREAERIHRSVHDKHFVKEYGKIKSVELKVVK